MNSIPQQENKPQISSQYSTVEISSSPSPSWRHYEDEFCQSNRTDSSDKGRALPVSFRYRADGVDLDEIEEENCTTETKVWRWFERIFYFLRKLPIYHVRRRLKFIMTFQAVVSVVRIIPVILGNSYIYAPSIVILWITLLFGRHGVHFLVPKFLLFYKIGMQISVAIDLISSVYYYQKNNPISGGTSNNGNDRTVANGTGTILSYLITVVLFLLNIGGLLYSWKLRRLVKALESEREYHRTAIVSRTNPMDTSNRSSLRNFHFNRNCLNRSNHADSGFERRSLHVGSEVPNNGNPPTFIGNEVVTNKYTIINFIFVFFKLQFSRLANVYTTIIVILCFFSFSPVSPIASVTPLLIVFLSAAIKDIIEDVRRRKADKQINNQPVLIFREEEGIINQIDGKWKDCRVGDVVRLMSKEQVPADLLFLSGDRADGRCYVETSNLDGETNLKSRHVVSLTKGSFSAVDIIEGNHLLLEYDLPNASLFNFEGVLSMLKQGEVTRNIPLSMDNILLRGTELRNCEWILGLVLYTGAETKIQMNSLVLSSKRSKVEKSLNNMFVIVLLALFIIAIACTLGNNDWGIADVNNKYPWYLRHNKSDENISTDGVNSDFIFLSYVILFNNLIPLSMYVTMEGVRFVHARYIENDIEMYDATTNTPACVRNSNINEDLGQIQYIFSDKTGTLTKNEMVFVKCSIGGLKYNECEEDGINGGHNSNMNDHVQRTTSNTSSNSGKSKNSFNDPSLLYRLKNGHKTADDIHHFLLCMALCNTVSSEQGVYQAASPDEEAIVLAAEALGYALMKREGKMVDIKILGNITEWEVLNILEFNSVRKRMSVIVRCSDNVIRLLCKGADNVIFDRLSPNQSQGVCHVTKYHLDEYGRSGLRTLTLAMRTIEVEEYEKWSKLYDEAATSLNNRSEKLDAVAELVEVNMKLLGASGIEDSLQDGVGDCISSLRSAGINFWVLTGDKKETATSIAQSSQVIDDSMGLILLDQKDKVALRSRLEDLYHGLVEDRWDSTIENPVDVIWDGTKRIALDSYRNIISAISGQQTKVIRKRRRFVRNLEGEFIQPSGQILGDDMSYNMNMTKQLSTGDDEIVFPMLQEDQDEDQELRDKSMDSESMTIEEDIEYAMIIDGPTLTLLLEEDVKYLFLAVARECKSVICCRCSPVQKSSVVSLVTEPKLMWGPGFITLAIGDGANDVPMIQAASVGVGISGKEGRQAVLSSDYSIAQFKYLKRLLLVHGNYSYKRIAKLILFSFMKNVALSLSNFWFATRSMYSGLLMYFGILFTLYNALFTTIPIVVIAMYNQDVSPEMLMQFPYLYSNGLFGRSFNWMSFFGWCLLGVWHSFVIFMIPFVCDGYVSEYLLSLNEVGVFHSDPLGLWADGTAAYSYLIIASTAQVSLLTSNWTKFNFIATLGTLVFFLGFLFFHSSFYVMFGVDIYESFTIQGILVKLSSQPWYWLGVIFVVIASVLPNYILKAGRVLFYPEPSHLLREWNAAPPEVSSNNRDVSDKARGFSCSYNKSDGSINSTMT